jgi:hypothetical protein
MNTDKGGKAVGDEMTEGRGGVEADYMREASDKECVGPTKNR